MDTESHVAVMVESRSRFRHTVATAHKLDSPEDGEADVVIDSTGLPVFDADTWCATAI
jgi:hypothetical protein